MLKNSVYQQKSIIFGIKIPVISFDVVICLRSEQAVLQQKLAQIEKKIIVGGENLLDKAEEQEKLLEESAKELEERRQKADSLRKALEEKEVTLSMSYVIHNPLQFYNKHLGPN